MPLEERLAIDVLGVDLVDDDHAVDPALLRVLHEARRHHFNTVLALMTIAAVSTAARREGHGEEVRVARCVEEVDAGRFVSTFASKLATASLRSAEVVFREGCSRRR